MDGEWVLLEIHSSNIRILFILDEARIIFKTYVNKLASVKVENVSIFF